MSLAQRRADHLIGLWAEHFGEWYPTPEESEGTPAGLHAALARLDPADYERVACTWPIKRALVYLEMKRVQHSFDELDDTHGGASYR